MFGTSPQLHVLVVATEWSAAHGGVSTLNQRLCTGLATAGARVFCLVHKVSAAERAAAAAATVELIEARQTPGCTSGNNLMRRPSLPAGIFPDVVIGHGRVTGPAARSLCEDFYGSAIRVQLIHVAPNELEWWRPDRQDDASMRANERSRLELELAATAHLVAAIGPRLHQLALRDLHAVPGAPTPLRLDPGFDIPNDAPAIPPPGGPVQVLLMGRLEDAKIKGVDLAAKALSQALDLRGHSGQELELLVRGAPPDDCDALRDELLQFAANPALHVVVRPYSTDADQLRQDLARATLVLMPSRAEGFGLAGLEGIVAGAPTLVSSRSGLANLLTEILSPDTAARAVVPVSLDDGRDALRWGHEIAAVLRDPGAAYAAAGDLRLRLARERTWAMAAGSVFQAMTNLHNGRR